MNLFRKLKLGCTCSNSTSLPNPLPNETRREWTHPRPRPPQHTQHTLNNSFP